VEGGVGGGDLVEAEPGELTEDVVVGVVEGGVLVEVVDVLPVLEGLSVGVEHFLVDFKEGGFLDAAVVVGFVVLFEEEGLEVEDDFVAIGFVDDGNLEVDDPVLVKSSQLFGEFG
jgi:hypothetical protein